jgi:hypothetical protein
VPPPQSAGESGTQHVAIDWLGGDDDSAEYQRDTTARPTGEPANDTDCVAIFVVAAVRRTGVSDPDGYGRAVAARCPAVPGGHHRGVHLRRLEPAAGWPTTRQRCCTGWSLTLRAHGSDGGVGV